MNRLKNIVKFTLVAMLCAGVASAQQNAEKNNDAADRASTAAETVPGPNEKESAAGETASASKKDDGTENNVESPVSVSTKSSSEAPLTENGDTDATSSDETSTLEAMTSVLKESSGTVGVGDSRNAKSESETTAPIADDEIISGAQADDDVDSPSASGLAFTRARDRDGKLLLSVPIVGYWRTDEGYDLFTEKKVLWNPGLNLEVTLVSIRQRLHIAVSATWLRERAESKFVLGGEFHSKLYADMVALGARARFNVFSWFDAHARVYGGFESTKVKLSTDAGYFFIPRDEKFAAGGAVGVDFHVPSFRITAKPVKIPVFSPGILVEVGYEYRTPIDMQLVAEDDSDFAIETVALSSGKLNRSAPFIRVDMFLRF